MEDPLVHVVIVDYFKAEKVVGSVTRILSFTTSKKIFITVVDNSVDEKNLKILEASLGANRSVRIIPSRSNIGYTKAMNVGAAGIGCEFLLVLNPDVQILKENIFTQAIEFFYSKKDCAMVGFEQYNDDGTMPSIGRPFPNIISLLAKRIPILARFPIFKEALSKYIDPPCFGKRDYAVVDWLQSSCVFMRHQFWLDVCGYDERFFLFMADVKMGRDAIEMGKKSYLLKSSSVIADGIRASEGGVTALFTSRVLRWHVKDAFRYFLGI